MQKPRFFRPRLPGLAASIVILAGGLLVAFWVALFAELEHAYDAAIANAERDSASIARAFAEHTRRTLLSAEGLLRQIQRDLSQDRNPDLATVFRRNPVLSGITGYIAVVDAQGNAVMSAGAVPIHPGREGGAWFERVRAADPGSIFIGRPILERNTRLWTVPMALRQENADGSFAGAIYLSILCDYFDNFYVWADVGQHGAVAIYGLDGSVYARRSYGSSETGTSHPELALVAQAKDKPIGVYHMKPDIDGVARITSYRLLGEYPWIVTVGFADEDVLAPYFARRQAVIVQGAVLTLVSMLLAGMAAFLLERERRSRAAAARSEQRLRDAIESIDAGFVLFDADDRLVMCNEKYLGHVRFMHDRSSVMGIRYEDLVRAATASGWYTDPLAQRDPEAWVAKRVAEHRNPPREPVEVSVGNGRWVQISERRTADGFTVGIRTDITRRKQQEQALRESEERLQRLVAELEQSRRTLEKQASDLARLAEENENAKVRAEAASLSKSQFLANMSHELRTPLNAIIGFSDMMKGQMLGPIGSPRYIDYAKDIHASGTHLLSLINDVLDMSKIEAGRYTIHPEPLDGAEMLRSCMRLVRMRASESGVTLHMDPASGLSLRADARALKQVLLNLLTNAIKFTPSGGKVNLSASHERDGVLFRIADTGVGIAPEDLPRIGRRFEQANNALTRKGEGTGLGLALSRALVELHGGTLTIESTLGEGTTVTVWLPRSVSTGRAA